MELIFELVFQFLFEVVGEFVVHLGWRGGAAVMRSRIGRYTSSGVGASLAGPFGDRTSPS